MDTNNTNAIKVGTPTQTLMNVISPAAKELIKNEIIQSMSVIDWGKAMARCNEIIQKEILKSIGIKAYDPETDEDCPEINTANNSPGFDMVVVCEDKAMRMPVMGVQVMGSKDKIYRLQSKLRQVKGLTDFSQQTHFETTRRHSKKNEGTASDSGHVAYGCDEFDYVMVTLINIGKDGNNLTNRNNVDKWSFSLIPVAALIDEERGCCSSKISSEILKKYEFDPKNPRPF